MGVQLATRRDRMARRAPDGRVYRGPEGPSPNEIRRLRDAAVRGLRDAEWGTELGRLYLERQITPEMYSAGKRWRLDAVRHRRAIDVFPIKPVSLEKGIKSHPPDVDSPEGQEQARRDRDATESFLEAHHVLVMSGAESAVRRLCEEDQSLVGVQELYTARAGLAKLHEHYRLTDGRK
jgi:hypothetical protein